MLDATIRNIGHIRLKETDRLTATATELKRLGIDVEESADSLIVHPGEPAPATIETYDDHRMAMAFALVGNVVVDDPGCVAKTWPSYFAMLDRFGMVGDVS